MGTIRGIRALIALLGAVALISSMTRGTLPAQAATAPVDVLFIFDTTGSMGGAISEAKAQVRSSADSVRAEYPDSQFAVASVADYPPDTPWLLSQPLTSDLTAVQSAIDPLYASGGGDGPESYTRALYEAAQATIGWRAGARHLVVLINDNVPHDNDLNEGVPAESQTQPSPFNTGTDPGRDGMYGTGDDLDWQSTLALLKTSGIVFANVLYSGSSGYLPYWEWWTRQTGGVTAIGGAGTPLGDTLTKVVLAGATGGGRNLRYVALGDSYSSGEGAGAGWYFQRQETYYLCTFRLGPITKEVPKPLPSQTWTCEAKSRGIDLACHRAPTAWSFPLSVKSRDIPDWTKDNPSPDVINGACSGARIDDVLRNSFKGEQPQIKLLKTLSEAKQVDLVTITIGGNDLGFSTVILDCYTKPIACDMGRVTDDGTNPNHGIGLEARRIRDEIIPKLREAAPQARIVLVGYPRVMPKAGTPLVRCGNFTESEQAAVNRYVASINKNWRLAAEQAGATFVDIEDALDGNELCTNDSHMSKIYGPVIPNPRNSEQGHPTPAGQEDIASAVFRGLVGAGILNG